MVVKIGEKRVQRLKIEYELQGYFVITNLNFNCGVDIIIMDKTTGKVFKVIESTNYGKPQYYISPKKFKRYIDSLNKFNVLPDVTKEIVVSFKENLSKNQVKKLRKEGIRIRVIGGQD